MGIADEVKSRMNKVPRCTLSTMASSTCLVVVGDVPRENLDRMIDRLG